jgi:putative transcriptional regulator
MTKPASKNFLERMRHMLAAKSEMQAQATAATATDNTDKNTTAAPIAVEDETISSLKQFMHHADIAPIKINPNAKGMPQVLDASMGQGYLTGQLLVATPVIGEGCFQRSVIYIFTHHAQGAMGVIINQPLERVDFSSLVQGISTKPSVENDDMPVYFGGPVERHRGFVLHSAEYSNEHTITRHGGVAITASSSVLDDIIQGCGPEKAYLTVGFAGWDAGQLEQEIEQNSWITVPASQELVFSTEDELKWAKASKSLGIDMNFFSTAVGHA